MGEYVSADANGITYEQNKRRTFVAGGGFHGERAHIAQVVHEPVREVTLSVERLERLAAIKAPGQELLQTGLVAVRTKQVHQAGQDLTDKPSSAPVLTADPALKPPKP